MQQENPPVSGGRVSRMSNTSRILREVWVSRKISRIQLSRDLNLNKSTVSNIVGALIESGIISETAEGAAGPAGGRRPVHIELNRSFGYVLGFEIRPESYTAVAVDLAGDILFSRTEVRFHSARDFSASLVTLIKELTAELSWLNMPVLGAGIGISGIVDTENEIILNSIPLQITEAYDLSRTVCAEFDFPVFFENDANCCAWGELAFHRPRKLRNFVFTLVEFPENRSQAACENTAVGFGFVFGGQVYYGDRHSAGEFHSVFCEPGAKG